MKRRFQSAILWRLAAVAFVLSCAGIAATPVMGSGPPTAVTQFVNSAGAPGSTVSALGSALYQAVEQSGKFTAVGGGPLQTKPGLSGDIISSALTEAGRAGAQEVIMPELLSTSGGSVVYRLTAYRVNPLYFIRAQVFTQSALSSAPLTAGFVGNLATIHAPRTAVGTIFATAPDVKADLGDAEGFHTGQEFNVVRNGQRVAQAHITGTTRAWATVSFSNAVGGYKPQVGDQLVGIDPLPAVPPAARHSSSFSLWAIAAATGVALLSIGHGGNPAAAGTPGPTPSPTAPPGTFKIVGESQNGVAPSETFTFTFNQPVNTGLINFTNTLSMSYLIPAVVNTSPVTNLGGPAPSFDPTNTVLTIGPTSSLQPGQTLQFTFYSAMQDTVGDPLTQTMVTFTASSARHPLRIKHVRLGPAGGVPLPWGPHKP